MKKIRRSDIVDYLTYEEIRPEFRARVLAEKARRRIHVGDWFTFLFENELTMRYQVQEMMRAERIIQERAILHEMEVYNDVLGGAGELACTLLVELADIEDRRLKLLEWRALPEHVYLRMDDDRLIRPRVDEGQRDSERISSVQYLKFHVGNDIPLAIGIDLPGIAGETPLTEGQRKALAEDLEG